MRIIVDYDRCDSQALCAGILPDIFEVRDDGFMYVLNETPGEELRSQLEEAVRICPTQAISLAEE